MPPINKFLGFRYACKYTMFVNNLLVRNMYVGIELALCGFIHNIYHTHLKNINKLLWPLQKKKKNKQIFHVYML